MGNDHCSVFYICELISKCYFNALFDFLLISLPSLLDHGAHLASYLTYQTIDHDSHLIPSSFHHPRKRSGLATWPPRSTNMIFVSSFTRRQFILARHLAWKIINSIPSQEKDSIHNIKRMFDQALSLPVVPSPSIPSRQNSKRKIRSNPRQSDKIRRDETQLQTITGRSDSCQAYQMSGHWTTTSEISDRLLRSVRSIKAAETANLDRAEQG